MFKNVAALVFAGAFILVGSSSAFAYEVKSGDTMYNIAKVNGISLMELSKLNPEVSNLNLIYVGQNIKTNVNNTQNVSVVVGKPTETVNHVINITNAERDLMARLVRAEAESESFEGKIAVASVIFNRVASSQFPNSITDVIYQKGQFSPVSNGAINSPADAESIRAVDAALISDQTNGALFFYNPRTATSRWLDSKETIMVIGNHTFK